MKVIKYDKIIIGAGLYGLYSALFCAKRGEKILLLEMESSPFQRATYINQARVHQGYHYPRSLSTAIKSAGYFERFNKDYAFCINKQFEQIYATSSNYSWTNAAQFIDFCRSAKIPCEELNPNRYFKRGMCDGAFLTREYTYDAEKLCCFITGELSQYKGASVQYGVSIQSIRKDGGTIGIAYDYQDKVCFVESRFVLNATYASTNQILSIFGGKCFPIKYELCEIILCSVNESMKQYGFTVMDGPFFSIMPFGMTGKHSLTSVTFTPHSASYNICPEFDCQNLNDGCSTHRLGNCNLCASKPGTAFAYMSHLARKYLRDEYQFYYERSLFSVKPILVRAEIDDSRPTIIRKECTEPTFVSVLSGKINTVYDLDEVLMNG